MVGRLFTDVNFFAMFRSTIDQVFINETVVNEDVGDLNGI